MERPKLTVAIPTYNGARHLAEALRGIEAQQGVTFDLLLCDDRSDDDTVALATEQLGD
ncbi:glycosyltransferase family 2 protein, partial [Singulisphaera rosea]